MFLKEECLKVGCEFRVFRFRIVFRERGGGVGGWL